MSISGTKKFVKRLGGKFFREILPLYPGLKNSNIILLYHRVLREIPESLYDPSLFVTASTFEMHIKEISKMFHIVPLEEIVQRNNGGGRLCAITFDDGWIDNYEVAFPIIKRHKVPATIFISTRLISSGGSLWFENLWNLANWAIKDRKVDIFIDYFQKLFPTWKPKSIGERELSMLVNTLKNYPSNTLDDVIADAYRESGAILTAKRMLINWEDAYEMSQFGISFGSHGLHHYILNRLDSVSKRIEVIESLGDLKKRPIHVCRYFSYPEGVWDNDCIMLVQHAGYQGALTARLGHNGLENNPYLLRRIGLHETICNSQDLFWFRIFQAFLLGSGHDV